MFLVPLLARRIMEMYCPHHTSICHCLPYLLTFPLQKKFRSLKGQCHMICDPCFFNILIHLPYSYFLIWSRFHGEICNIRVCKSKEGKKGVNNSNFWSKYLSRAPIGRALSNWWESCVFSGKITCANVLSDLYAMGVTECDNMLMLVRTIRDLSGLGF